MFSNIENVNILTSVLKSHGCRRVVVCPGSRNAPIVHNLNEIEGITCYPVTDERSAAFMAIGMALEDPYPCPDPIAVCVTSGSALLNMHPAVAEAYYQKLPVIFISADRPEAWIGQQDGQTLPQANVFGTLVNRSVNLPVIPPVPSHEKQHANEASAEEQRLQQLHDELYWMCERDVNEAIVDCVHRKIGPVHINIQIQEPLYDFTEKKLPETRWVDYVRPRKFYDVNYGDIRDFLQAKRPMIVVGQDYPMHQVTGIKGIASWAVILCESTALGHHGYGETTEATNHFDEVLAALEKKAKAAEKAGDQEALLEVESYKPDFILYVGGCIVSKRLKQFLRSCKDVKVWRVSPDGDGIDTFMHLDRIFEVDPTLFSSSLIDYEQVHHDEVKEYIEKWNNALWSAECHAKNYDPEFSSMAAVKYFQEEFKANSNGDTDECRLFYGNSMAIRLANIYAREYVHCLRGVNGIEGTLSAAAGLSIIHSEQLRLRRQGQNKVYCILGDLSFFYDQNALWNPNLNGCLRIIVLNNGGGAIFGKFKGLKESAARERLVMAAHQTSAVNVCQANDIIYMGADNMKTLKYGIDQLIHAKSDRPMLLEVFTDIETDNRVVEEYYDTLKLTTRRAMLEQLRARLRAERDNEARP